MTAHRHGRSTIAVHGRRVPLADWAPVITPIFQSTTFVNPVGGEEEVLYTRYGNNPNQVDLGRKYSALEGAEDAVFVSSGMAATALAHLAILRPGDHLLASKWIYGGTRKLFDEEFGRLGIGVSYADPDQPRHWRKMLRKNTRALFLESPTNPLIRVLDLGVPSQVAREFGLALLVDATFASPVNFRPIEHGADVVISSATKYLNGHNDVIAGGIAGHHGRGRGSDPAHAALGTGDRSPPGLAPQPRHEDAGRAHGAAQPERNRRGHVGRGTEGNFARALSGTSFAPRS